jgi:replicative DNA helicase
MDVEQALIGAALINEIALDEIALTCQADDIYDPMHRRMFNLILSMRSRGENVTPLTVGAAMSNDPGLKDLGGTKYLISLARAASRVPNVKDYIRILRDFAMRRQLIQIAEETKADCLESAAVCPIVEILQRMRTSLGGVNDRVVSSNSPMSHPVGEFLNFRLPPRAILLAWPWFMLGGGSERHNSPSE